MHQAHRLYDKKCIGLIASPRSTLAARCSISTTSSPTAEPLSPARVRQPRSESWSREWSPSRPTSCGCWDHPARAVPAAPLAAAAAGLIEAGGKHLAATDTMLLDDAVIHAVANPLRAFSPAIHVCVGDFFCTPRSGWTPDTLEERPFDLARARQAYADANERWKRETEAGP